MGPLDDDDDEQDPPSAPSPNDEALDQPPSDAEPDSGSKRDSRPLYNPEKVRPGGSGDQLRWQQDECSGPYRDTENGPEPVILAQRTAPPGPQQPVPTAAQSKCCLLL